MYECVNGGFCIPDCEFVLATKQMRSGSIPASYFIGMMKQGHIRLIFVRMNIRIGHKVRFLNEKGEGIVTRFKDKKTAFVEVDGFEIPYLLDNLVLAETEIVFNTEANHTEESTNEAVFFVLEPDHEMPLLQAQYAFYLFNSSSYNLLFTYAVKDGNNYQTLKHGELGPFQKLLLKQIQKQFLPEFAYHKIEMLFFKKQHHTSQIPCAHVIHISESILKYQGFVPNHDFKFPVWVSLLKDDFSEGKKIAQQLTHYDVERLKTIKEYKKPQKKSVPHHNPAFFIEKEVDLHAQHLLDSFANMSNHEILQIQLKHFQKNLDEAISKRYYKIIFIHGIGNGRLKQELHAILKNYHDELHFQDGDYKKYGFGATEVTIR